MDWLTENKIPIGLWARDFFDWLDERFGPSIDGFSEGLADGIDWIIEAILAAPSLLVVAVFVALVYALQRRWQTALIVLLGFLFILNQGYWEETIQSLVLVLIACAICMAIGVPLGVWGAHNPKVYRAMVPVLDMMQTLPTFVYLIPMVVLFSIGVAISPGTTPMEKSTTIGIR